MEIHQRTKSNSYVASFVLVQQSYTVAVPFFLDAICIDNDNTTVIIITEYIPILLILLALHIDNSLDFSTVFSLML